MKKLIVSLFVFLWVFKTDLATTENVPPAEMNPNEDIRIFFGNGIDTTFEEAKKQAMRISALADKSNIGIFYKGTRGFWKDFQDAKNNLKTGDTNEYSKIIAKEINEACARHSKNLMLIFYSEGAINLKNSLPLILKENRSRLEVILIAPAAYISHELVCKVTHLIDLKDSYIIDIFTNLPGNEQLKESAKNPSVQYVGEHPNINKE